MTKPPKVPSPCDCALCAPPDRQAIDRKALAEALDRHGIPHNMSDTKEGDECPA